MIQRGHSPAQDICQKTHAETGPRQTCVLGILSDGAANRICFALHETISVTVFLFAAKACMFVIGLETSGLVGSVALLRAGELVAERTLGEAGRRHAQSLVLELRELLQAAGVTSGDITGIAVSKGPGSFTGLRVGLVCAKTFAYATGCRFVAVETFAAISDNCPPEVRDVWIVENAQRGELFVSRFARTADDSWNQVTPIQTVVGEDWLSARESHETVTGPGLLHQDMSSVRARLLTDASIAKPRAETIAKLGQRMLLNPDAASSSEDFDFWKAVPVYIRPSAAEEQRAKRDALARTPIQ